MKKLYLLATCGAVMLIFSCAPSSPVVTGCVPVQNWTQTEEAALANELAASTASPMIWAMHDDWARMRAASRACQNAIRLDKI